MANKKISELDPAATPLDFSEEVEILQAGDNVRVALAWFGENLPYVTFDTAPTPGAHQTGKLYWDADAGTMAFMTDVTDVTLQVGQETYVKVRNNSGAQIDNGEAVYITGALGNRPTVALAQADAIATMRVLGLATANIANNADGYITVRGVVRDLDTSAFSEGDSLWLSAASAGALVNTVPAAGYSVLVGVVLYAHNTAGQVLVNPAVAGILGNIASGDYLEVFSDGSVLLHGEATAWDDLRVPLNATKLGGSKDPDFAILKNDGGTSQGVFVYWFDRSTEEELYFAVQMPHAWLAGSAIDAHVHFVPKSTGGAGDVICWGLEYVWSNIGDLFGNTTIISANDTLQGDASLLADKHYLTELGQIDATGKTGSSMLVCRVFRDAAGALKTDDYNDDAGLLEIDFHFQINKLGSRDEYP